jgi:hypothetical protein
MELLEAKEKAFALKVHEETTMKNKKYVVYDLRSSRL